jgi:hypothetical protein
LAWFWKNFAALGWEFREDREAETATRKENKSARKDLTRQLNEGRAAAIQWTVDKILSLLGCWRYQLE